MRRRDVDQAKRHAKVLEEMMAKPVKVGKA
jgi:hypothetical protein